MIKNLIKKEYYPITIFAILFAAIYIILLDYIAVPWLDEIGTADTAINFLRTHKWESNVWNYTYPPLHSFLLMGWMSLFGISHISVCSMNVVFALISFLIIESWMINKKLFESVIVRYSYLLLFWLACYSINGIMVRGRIDMLTMMFSVLLIIALIREGKTKTTYLGIVASSIFLMLSCFYIIPVFVIISLFGFFVCPDWKEWFKRCVLMASGFFIGFVLVCAFYYKIGFLFHFLSSLFSFNANVSSNGVNSSPFVLRLMNAYYVNNRDLSYLLFLLLAWLLLMMPNYLKTYNKRRMITILLFVTLLPCIMTMVGRFYGPYKWMIALPIVCILPYLIECCKVRMLKYVTCCLIMCMSLLKIGLIVHNQIKPNVEERIALRNYFDENEDLLSLSDNVFFRDGCLYYDLIDRGKNYYALFLDNVDIAPFIQELEDLSIFENYKEKAPQVSLPDEGLMIMASTKHFKEWKEGLLQQGYQLQVLSERSSYSITQFKR